MNPQDITAVVVSYYRADRLRKCLQTLCGLSHIIVWDNNTQGEDREKIKNLPNEFSNVELILSPENVGLPRAWNQGIVHSKTDWVLLTCDDMLFDSDWFDVLTDILDQKPHLEQIHLNAWNAVALHKKTIVRMGWWDERYRYYPSMEDDDWYLRTVEDLGYSPYGTWAEHINFPSNYLQGIKPYIDKKQELFNRDDNYTYFCNSPYSKHKVIGYSTITGQSEDAGSRNTAGGSFDNQAGMTGVEFHFNKWELVFDPQLLTQDGILLAKDGRIWKRQLPDLDFYPEVRKDYAKTYYNIEL